MTSASSASQNDVPPPLAPWRINPRSAASAPAPTVTLPIRRSLELKDSEARRQGSPAPATSRSAGSQTASRNMTPPTATAIAA